MTFITNVKNRYKNAVIEKCRDSGCGLQINKKGDFVILKGEKIVPESKICDCIIFRNDKKIIIAELKSTSIRVNDVIEKFSNSGKKAREIAADLNNNDTRMYFVLLAKKYGSNSSTRLLKDVKVEVGSDLYPIIRGRCGDPLLKLIT